MCHATQSFCVKEERKKKEAEASRLAAEAGQAREQLLVVGVCHSNSYVEHITWMGHATEHFFVKEERKKKEAEALSLAAEAGQAREQLLVVGVCHSNSYVEHITWMGPATESFSVKEERKKKEAEASRLAAEAGQAREQLL